MKKHSLFLLPLVVILSSCTYGSYSMTGGSLKTSNNQIKADYKKFNGYIARKFKALEDCIYTFTFNCGQKENNEGTLTLIISGYNTSTIENIVSLDEPIVFDWPADYKFEVKISSSSHSGYFDLSWTTNQI